jgi:hypothetical protein
LTLGVDIHIHILFLLFSLYSYNTRTKKFSERQRDLLEEYIASVVAGEARALSRLSVHLLLGQATGNALFGDTGWRFVWGGNE